MALLQTDHSWLLHALKEWATSYDLNGEVLLTPIQSGVINASFKLVIQHQVFFVKLLVPNSRLNRAANFVLQKRLSEQHMAPGAIYLDSEHRFQIDQWLNHEWQPIEQDDFTESSKLSNLAGALASIHRMNISTPILDLPNHWLEYFADLPTHVSSEQKCIFFERIKTLTPIWQKSIKQEVCLCHHDLAYGHVMQSSEKKQFILDWEYAGFGSPFFDLASCVLVNKMTAEDSNLMCRFYADNRQLSESLVTQQLNIHIPLAKLTNDLWMACYGNEIGGE